MRQNTPYDSLEDHQQHYNSQQSAYMNAQQGSSKEAMQQLYKNQLDQIMAEKQKMKEVSKQKQEEERREFNERAIQGKEAEKMKEISYKNYYNMLMSNQQHHQESYVSPFTKRDNMKDALINDGVQLEKKRFQIFEIEAKKREAERKNSYKNQLLSQIEERKRKEYMSKHDQLKEKQTFQRYTKLPEEINRYEKQRKKEDMEKYREDLDKVREHQNIGKNSTNLSESSLRQNSEYHNILTNPLPFNIQNPYILKEMTISKNQSSYLAQKGIQNLQS